MEGIGAIVSRLVEEEVGFKNGRDPDGEAWLVEETVVKEMLARWRYVCLGINERSSRGVDGKV